VRRGRAAPSARCLTCPTCKSFSSLATSRSSPQTFEASTGRSHGADSKTVAFLQ
ncbi:hypothetical protein SPRG_14953, partial [Saprolegnia parasitica CBS 223.65]